MFTGIVEDKGKVVRLEHQGQGNRLTLEIPVGLTEISLGDSINVNGACLTVVEKKGRMIMVDLSSETLQRTNLNDIEEGEEVNLERALKLMDRLGGHFVTGHIDGIGTVVEKRREGDFLQIRIRAPQSVTKHFVQKGSIAIDGISLTVNECQGDEIQITLIPFTLQKTTLLKKGVGDRVNLEADILGKYVEKLLDRKNAGSKELDRDFLREHGFLKE
ncbi:MAG: riboflavin synthase subunit alpha [Deltaproteobacteria bacterium RBG_16_47_11]|nr:MAG: riboflavin synthase subunit alpha [Deltaproteobacteria bacterium RBG_16_47_11]